VGRITPTCLDDDDRLRFSSIPPPHRSGTEKKESQAHRHNRACRPLDKPSSTSSCGPHHYDACTVRCCSQAALSQICQSSARAGAGNGASSKKILLGLAPVSCNLNVE